MTNSIAVKKSGVCGRDMLVVREKVINEIITKENLGPKIDIGIGVTFDSVIVTKIGIAAITAALHIKQKAAITLMAKTSL